MRLLCCRIRHDAVDQFGKMPPRPDSAAVAETAGFSGVSERLLGGVSAGARGGLKIAGGRDRVIVWATEATERRFNRAAAFAVQYLDWRSLGADSHRSPYCMRAMTAVTRSNPFW